MAEYNITYRKSDLQALVDKLKSYVKLLEDDLRQCTDKKNQIKDFWEDSAADDYYEVIGKNIVACERTIKDTKEQIVELQGMIDKLADATDDIKKGISVVSDLVAKLDA
jgi:predicted  nucleic acid-binding Zn-ribbon protein